MGQFDFYVLALSWSPGFCETGGPAGRRQCDTGSGLGFVTHGLWPQREQGYPSFCEPSGRFARGGAAEASGLFLTTTSRAINGASTGPARARARAAISARCGARATSCASRTASRNRISGSKVLPSEIERAFAAVNPGLRSDMIAVSCGRRILQEVRVCLDKDLRGFRQCSRRSIATDAAPARSSFRRWILGPIIGATMNYRHAFHAGNFADVMKHALLVRILVYLQRKETPLRVIDTHAGIGLYDLTGDEAGRTRNGSKASGASTRPSRPMSRRSWLRTAR